MPLKSIVRKLLQDQRKAAENAEMKSEKVPVNVCGDAIEPVKDGARAQAKHAANEVHARHQHVHHAMRRVARREEEQNQQRGDGTQQMRPDVD
jgi:hypothetical protein